MWGGDNALHNHMEFAGGKTAFYDGMTGAESARFNGTNFLLGSTSDLGARFQTRDDNSNTNPLSLASPATASGIVIMNYSFGVGRYSAISMEACNASSVQSASIVAQSVSSGQTPDLIFTGRDSNSSNAERMRLNSEGHLTISNQPAFNATRNGASAIQMASNSGLDVIFTSEDFDNGNCYNNSNGRFTAPVSGKYFFGIQFYTGFSVTAVRVMHANWTKNGSIHASADLFGGISNAGGTHYHPTVNAQIMMSLSANDYVTFRLGNISVSGSGNTYLYGSKGTRFFGHLVA